MTNQGIAQVQQFLRENRGLIFPSGHRFGPVNMAFVNAHPNDCVGCYGCDGLYYSPDNDHGVLSVAGVGDVCFGCANLCAQVQLVRLKDSTKIQEARRILKEYRGTIFGDRDSFGPRTSGPLFRCDGCSGTYTNYPDRLDSLDVEGAGRLCMSCLFLTAQMCLMDNNLFRNWGWKGLVSPSGRVYFGPNRFLRGPDTYEIIVDGIIYSQSEKRK